MWILRLEPCQVYNFIKYRFSEGRFITLKTIKDIDNPVFHFITLE
jgi:hypothetical protein